MRINTNVAALNSYNQLSNTQDNLSKSLERLSSGKRINGAADDAAGLAISEKMNGQVRGLGQAQRNAQDAISMNQTAEGALKESHSILQRMRELAVQSANDTNTESDRAEIQEEVNQLAKELTRIGETTEFNTQNLLDGSLENMFQIGANEDQNMEMDINDMRADTLGVSEAEGVYEDISNDTISTDISGTVVEDGSYSVEELDEAVEVDGTDRNYVLRNDDNEIVGVSADGSSYDLVHDSDGTTGEDPSDLDMTSAVSLDLTSGSFDKVTTGDITFENIDSSDVDVSATNTLADSVDGLSSGTYDVVDGDDREDVSQSDNVIVNDNDEVVAYSDGSGAFSSADGTELFDAGASLDSGSTIEIGGDGGINVSTQSAADSAISTIDDAIGKVSSERSKLGAVQNRLEHTINNLNTAEENLTAAESRISDVDMAEEMMNMSKQQILSQAGTAMMAQANQLPQGVLKLLG